MATFADALDMWLSEGIEGLALETALDEKMTLENARFFGQFGLEQPDLWSCEGFFDHHGSMAFKWPVNNLFVLHSGPFSDKIEKFAAMQAARDKKIQEGLAAAAAAGVAATASESQPDKKRKQK